MPFRDRIRELRRVAARELRPNPRNWRTHPPRQRELLSTFLHEIGFADALLARELADGSLELIDGHLRQELADDAEVPVLVLDVSEEEAMKLLLSLDPLSALAGADTDRVRELLDKIGDEDDGLEQLFADVQGRTALLPDPHFRGAKGDDGAKDAATTPHRDIEIPESFQVVVHCEHEEAQRELFERLKEEGYTCRLLML